jgi:hypothetical protein
LSYRRQSKPDPFIINKLYPLKVASAGAVRRNPAEAFAKGGNSDIDEIDPNLISPKDNRFVKFISLSKVTTYQ